MKHWLIACFFSLLCYADPLAHIVLLGDPHLPGKFYAQKEALIEDVNRWNDVTMVVALGDLVQETGNDAEYKATELFFTRLHKPLHAINGNHDYLYADERNEQGKHQKATAEIQRQKLQRFCTLFHLEKPYYTLNEGPFFLIFLSANDPSHLAQISEEELVWFQSQLETHKKRPTLVFFHAPLKRTLRSYNKYADTPNFVAQPQNAIDSIIQTNPQIMLWVSGHTHTTPKEESFASSLNWYNDHLLNLHNMDMNHEVIVTHSLFLYEDRVVIKTFDHAKKRWNEGENRTVFLPKF